MILGHIERGTKMMIFEEYQERAVSDEYEAVFRFLESAELFVVQCTGLYDNYSKINPAGKLSISFTSELNTYIFAGRAVEKQRGNGMIMIEKLTDIKIFNRRMYERDELRSTVLVYGVPKTKLDSFHYDKLEFTPDIADTTFDISAGGLCIISNNLLNSRYDPYYILEFSLGEKDRFLLPSKLVRRANYPRSKIGKYDYGFQFIFDNIPDEKGRLSRAILSRKLSYRKN